MPRNLYSIARDYNRGLWLPVRVVHVIGAPLWAAHGWAWDPRRRHWAVPLIWATVLGLVLIPLDGTISGWCRSLHVGGDVRKELDVLQQWGGVTSLLLTALIIALADPARRRRLADLFVAAGLTSIVVLVLKMFIGRPRPRLGEFYDADTFLGPFGAHPFITDHGSGVWHAWEFWRPISSDLWSMPSSHTSAAMALSVFLMVVYPRLKPLAVAMVVVVGLARVLFVSHYPSDVVVGAGVGYAVAWQAVGGEGGGRVGWGQRLLERLGATTRRNS